VGDAPASTVRARRARCWDSGNNECVFWTPFGREHHIRFLDSLASEDVRVNRAASRRVVKRPAVLKRMLRTGPHEPSSLAVSLLWMVGLWHWPSEVVQV